MFLRAFASNAGVRVTFGARTGRASVLYSYVRLVLASPCCLWLSNLLNLRNISNRLLAGCLWLPSIMDGINERSLSETDVNTTPPNNYLSTRIKRKRDDDVANDFSIFKEEMKNMISSMLASYFQEFKKNTDTLKEIQRTNRNIEDSVAFLAGQYEEFKNKIVSLEGQITEDRKYIVLLESKIEDLQRENRKANLEIKNVPKKTNETKGELVDMIIALAGNIECPMTKSDIKDIYRVRGKQDRPQNTPIVVEMSSTILKKDILKMSKAFNIRRKETISARHLGLRLQEDTSVYITEQLTPKAARLHFLARDLKKSGLYKYCWTDYGRVYVKKDDNSRAILISNEAQIEHLSKEK